PVRRAARATALRRRQAAAHRLAAHHLSKRLSPGSYVEAARFGLRDTRPPATRCSACSAGRVLRAGWVEDPRLIQTYRPRAAGYVVALEDFGRSNSNKRIHSLATKRIHSLATRRASTTLGRVTAGQT